MIKGITLRLGQWFFLPLTKLIIAMIKHGMNTNKTAAMKMKNIAAAAIPKNKIPMNAMPLVYIYIHYCTIKC